MIYGLSCVVIARHKQPEPTVGYAQPNDLGTLV